MLHFFPLSLQRSDSLIQGSFSVSQTLNRKSYLFLLLSIASLFSTAPPAAGTNEVLKEKEDGDLCFTVQWGRSTLSI